MSASDADVQRAFTLMRAQRHAEARDVLEDLVRRELADAVVYETLGDVREKLGDGDGAVDAWRMAVDLFLHHQKPKRARAVLELWLILRPDDADAIERLSLVDGAPVA